MIELLVGGICLGFAVLSLLFLLRYNSKNKNSISDKSVFRIRNYFYFAILVFAAVGSILLILGTQNDSDTPVSSTLTVINIIINVTNSSDNLNDLVSLVAARIGQVFELDADEVNVNTTVVGRRRAEVYSGLYQVELYSDFSAQKVETILNSFQKWDCAIIAFSNTCTFQNTTKETKTKTKINWNSPSDKHRFIPVPPKNISAGHSHTCYIGIDQKVRCFGSNEYGQLGRGFNSNFENFDSGYNPIAGLDNVKSVVTGYYHTCALIRNGKVFCWGLNEKGQLGIGNRITIFRPVMIDLTNINEISAAGNHTCAVENFLRVYCWGANEKGQLGIGTTIDISLPTLVNYSLQSNNGLIPDFFRHIETGYDFTCILFSIKKEKFGCFGNNDFNQLGINVSNAFISYATYVSETGGIGGWAMNAGLKSIQPWKLAAGKMHACALEYDIGSSLWTWGGNSKGQLGIGNNQSTRNITLISNEDIISTTAGGYHICVLFRDRTVACWGDNSFGQSTGSISAPVLLPQLVSIVTNVTAISAGEYHTCVQLLDGDIGCWGKITQ